MLAYILGITKRDNEEITNRARGITNRDSLKDFKLGQRDFKLGQKLQIGEEITNLVQKIFLLTRYR